MDGWMYGHWYLISCLTLPFGMAHAFEWLEDDEVCERYWVGKQLRFETGFESACTCMFRVMRR